MCSLFKIDIVIIYFEAKKKSKRVEKESYLVEGNGKKNNLRRYFYRIDMYN